MVSAVNCPFIDGAVRIGIARDRWNHEANPLNPQQQPMLKNPNASIDEKPLCRGCSCTERPRCAMIACADYAVVSVWRSAWLPYEAHPKIIFCCAYHWELMQQFIPGIHRPPHADESWRPSIDDMVRLAYVKLQYEDRKRREPIEGFVPMLKRQEQYTPQQQRAAMVLQRHAQANRH